MESQVLFNIIVAVSGGLGGWTLKVIWDAIKTLDNDVKGMNREIHQDFVRREDFKQSVAEVKSDMRDGFREVKEMISAVFTKLDSKQDKP